LKIGVDDREAFEPKLRAAGGTMDEPYWVGKGGPRTDALSRYQNSQIEKKLKVALSEAINRSNQSYGED